MAAEIPVVPKAERIFMHTGNIVNWNRLKKKTTQSPPEELAECLSSTLEAWLSKADRDQLQYATSIQCYDEKFCEKLPEEERQDYKLTDALATFIARASAVKVIMYNLCSEALSNAVDHVMSELGVKFVETLIIGVPEAYRNVDALLPLWQQLETLIDEEKVLSLGVADLDTEQLSALYEVAKVKPTIGQVNLDSCCVIPPEMTAFAKENDIQLLTHNDPADILPQSRLQSALSGSLTERDSEGWQPCWVMRYSVVIKGRGIIKTKGYIVSAAREWQRRP